MRPETKNGGGRMMMSQVTPQAGGLVRQEIGATEMQVSSETAQSALAAQMEAIVKARCALARHAPRDIELVRVRVLKDCARPAFAEAAVYSKPVGKKKNEVTGKWEEQYIEGPSVRFAEAVMRHMGNVWIDAMVTRDDADTRIIKVMAMDLETNATDAQDVTIEKTVERRDGKGREVLGERKNSYGDTVYIVRATEEELLNKVNSAIAKMRRNKILELAPADIVDEAMEACRNTAATEDAQDPDAAKRKVIDAFAKHNVQPADLTAFLGHALDVITPAELARLRKIIAALATGETTWAVVMDGQTPEEQRQGKVTAPPSPQAAQPSQTAPTPQAAPAPTPMATAPEPTSVAMPAAPTGAPDPIDVLLAEIQQTDARGLDQIYALMDKLTPKGHPRRQEVGQAIQATRKRLQGVA